MRSTDCADGMINDFQACNFSPQQLVCGKAGAPASGQCLAANQADALQKIFGGARNSRGESLYGDFAWDTGIAQPAWRSMHLGSAGGVPANATLGVDVLRNFVLTPPDPDFDPLQLRFRSRHGAHSRDRGDQRRQRHAAHHASPDAAARSSSITGCPTRRCPPAR